MITIVKISGDKVRVGIDAPSNVLVLRDELEAHVPAVAEGKEAAAAGEAVTLRHSA